MNDISNGQVQSRLLRSYSALTVAGVMDYGPSRWPYDLVFMGKEVFFSWLCITNCVKLLFEYSEGKLINL